MQTAYISRHHIYSQSVLHFFCCCCWCRYIERAEVWGEKAACRGFPFGHAACLLNAHARSNSRPWGPVAGPWPHFTQNSNEIFLQLTFVDPVLLVMGTNFLCFPAPQQPAFTLLWCLALMFRVKAAGVVLRWLYMGLKWLLEGIKLVFSCKWSWQQTLTTQILWSSLKCPLLWDVLIKTSTAGTSDLSFEVWSRNIKDTMWVVWHWFTCTTVFLLLRTMMFLFQHISALVCFSLSSLPYIVFFFFFLSLELKEGIKKSPCIKHRECGAMGKAVPLLFHPVLCLFLVLFLLERWKKEKGTGPCFAFSLLLIDFMGNHVFSITGGILNWKKKKKNGLMIIMFP